MQHTVDMANQQWVRDRTGASLRALGERLGLNHVTVGRRIDDNHADTCIAIARAYDQDPLEWLAGWGILTAAEVSNGEIADALRAATDLQLAEQLLERIKAGSASDEIESPLDNVHPLMRPEMSGLPDSVAAHRGEVGIADITSEAEEPQQHTED